MLRRTSALTLAIAGCLGLILGRVARPLIERSGGIAPTVGWSASLALLLGAGVLLALAVQTHRVLNRDRRVMHAERGVRLLALAKASALVGAFVAGLYAGYAVGFADAWASDLGRERVVRSVIAAVSAVAVMIAGLLLERACRIPGDGDDGGAVSGEASPA